MTEPVIKVDALVKKYGNFMAVDGISFTVDQGEVFAFLGPNGAGKTTTVEILETLRTPTSGSVSVLGMDIRRQEQKIKQKVGVMPQSFNAFDWLTVRENIEYFGSMYSKTVDIDHLIETFGLKDKRRELFKNLSGGLKQRVGIALALVNDPDIVFLDEPTTGLDPRARRDVWEAVRELKNRGKTVFLTTHYMDEAYYLADRIDVIFKGKIVAEGTPEDLINKYGGGNTLIIRDCCEKAREQLVRAIPGSRISGSDILTKLPPEDGMASIAKAVSILNNGDLSCKEIYVKKSTLEDVFLNLTGEKLTEEAS
ncbi:MAG TPA: ABC transporter ATP-binding protein [Methanocella sp.]|uniref:ABC transporter ATP-binding protein n=1 Tax=Methanocella sp. TaxID=2052833 RepID=UPI002B887B62|nr:ABC transporter ATP-binding protein [Methanocella sp.]HTY91766.1 ABC transporter ATP-binding protein [Methanocella sp.]